VYWLDPPNNQLSAIDLRIRAFGSCAFFMLTTILSIGPLARLAASLTYRGIYADLLRAS
jgi:hypothetical protein